MKINFEILDLTVHILSLVVTVLFFISLHKLPEFINREIDKQIKISVERCLIEVIEENKEF